MQTQMSYLTNDRLNKASIAVIDSSEFNVAIFDDIHTACSELQKTQMSMIEAMGNLVREESNIIKEQSREGLRTGVEIDIEFLTSVNKQVQKQQLLEMHAVNKVTNAVQGLEANLNSDMGQAIGHDEAVTLLAVFAYPPYLNPPDIAALLAV